MIVFPFPPSIDAAYGQRKGFQRYYSKKAKEWLNRCPKVINEHYNAPVHIAYDIYFPDNRARDCSNYVKLIEDYIVRSGIIEDDNWRVVQSFAVTSCGIDKLNPRIEVNIINTKKFNSQ